ncbi:MAG: AAA family ATPase, partial [Bacillota bacterium]
MLLRFELENFLSFDENQEFSLFPGRQEKKSERLMDTVDGKLLNLSVLYGANASGKTNFIEAIDFSKAIILKGIEKLKSEEKYFKINSKNKDIASSFEYEIMIDDKPYAYGFKVNLSNKRIIGEWFYELGEEEKCIYDLSFDHPEDNVINEKYNDNDRFSLLIDDIPEMGNVLILSEILRRKYYKNNEIFMIFNKVYKWFRDDLRVVGPEDSPAPIALIFQDDLRDNILDMLKNFDTGIKDFDYINRRKEEVEIPEFILDKIL